MPNSQRSKLLPLLLLFLALLLGGAGSVAASEAGLEPFESFVEKAAQDWLRANPTAATAAQYFAGAEQASLDRELIATDNLGLPLNPTARRAKLALIDHTLSQLARYRRADLTPIQKISAASLAWQLSDARRTASVAQTQFIFDQFRGLQVRLVNFLSQTHPIRNEQDIDHYLSRLDHVGSVIDEGIATAEAQQKKGILPPKFILEATLGSLDQFLDGDPGQNVLVASLKTRAATLTGLDPAKRDAAETRAQQIVVATILPAFERLRALLTGQLVLARDNAGMWRLPGGDAAYRVLLRSETTTDMTPDQVHAVGLREVARIEAEMDRILQRIGLTDGSVQQRYDRLQTQLQPPAEPDPRPALLTKATEILRDAETRSAASFDLRPRAPVEVLREPPFTERTAAAHYTAPAPDGSRPGRVWLPLPGPTYNMLGLRSLIYHEGVPGHHFQIALQQELPDIPKFRQKRVFGGLPAFAEGWGLYAEHLAVEQGWYQGDDQGLLGQLAAELFRARRLVVDTGLHAQHWTRQQAIDYGIPAVEVDRYVVYPGQACAYKIGELQILALRDKAQRALGDRFSVKQFHTLLLTTGTVPLAVLRRVVEDFIESGKK